MTEIDPADLKIETWPPRSQGGQHVGIRSGLRVEHIPTGLVAIVDIGRAQYWNRAVAFDMILGGLTSPHFR